MTTLIVPSDTQEILAGLSANIEALGAENRQLRERLATRHDAETRRLALEEAAAFLDEQHDYHNKRAREFAAVQRQEHADLHSNEAVAAASWAKHIRSLASGEPCEYCPDVEGRTGRFCASCGEHLGAKPCDHCARIDAEESTKPPPEERGEAGEPVRYACAPCQMVGVVVDEDGCCATCGADAVPVDASGRVSFVAERERARTLLESFEHNAARGLKKTLVVIRRKGPPAGEFARTSLGRGEIANAVEEDGMWRWAVYVENATAIRRLRAALADGEGVRDGR